MTQFLAGAASNDDSDKLKIQDQSAQRDQLQTPVNNFIEKNVNPFIKEYEFQVDFNRSLGILFSLAAIGLSLGVTLAGVNNNARLAAGLGAASAAVQSAFGIFPLEKRVWFYRACVAEAHKIKSFLEYRSDYSVDKAIDDFEILRTKTLTQEPLNSIPDSFSPNSAADKRPTTSLEAS